MKKMILHIGTHKTGSTAIQDVLSQSAEPLKRQRAYYGRSDRPPFEKLPKHTSLFRAIVAKDPESFLTEKAAIEDDFAASGAETLILSEEGLSEPRSEIIEKMASFGDNFEITVVCFLRRQDFFVESLWNQLAKEGHQKRTIENFMRLPFTRARLGYATLLDSWSEIAAVKAFDYDEGKRIGITRAFRDMTGIRLRKLPSQVNVSLGMNTAAALATLHRFHKPYDRDAIKAAFEGDTLRYALGSRLREKLLEELAEQNAALERDYGISFSDEMPEEGLNPIVAPRGEALATALANLAPPKS